MGLPTSDEDWVGVWGMSPTAPRGEAVARATDASVLRVEDAFLRSVLPGRLNGGPPIGLCLDRRGVHFDASQPSDLEHLLANSPFDDTVTLNHAKAAIQRMAYWHLGKYSASDPAIEAPAPGYVVVLDQTEGDAALCGAGRNDFLEMLEAARQDHPALPIFIKTHPETAGGARQGHFREADADDRVSFIDSQISPWVLFEGAVAVYTHSSLLGFEAIFAGHKPHVFGGPFYAGWTLTQDRQVFPRRGRELTRAQLFAGAMIDYPVWYDPMTDALSDLDTAISTLAAEATAWREDRLGWVGAGMRRWKRVHFRKSFPGISFAGTAAKALSKAETTGRRAMVWGTSGSELEGLTRVEDGLLRSRGLGADLTPPVSFSLDDVGLALDPGRESRMERKIAESTGLPVAEIERSAALIRQVVRSNLTKYNLGGVELPEMPVGRKILVVGQVEDDASVQLGCSKWRTNDALLQETRARNPDAVILWKPHPDVEAGLRKGTAEHADDLADVTLTDVSALDAISAADEVWTLTSTLGFEALLRGVPVTCLGMPFYAGWGLTTDLADAPDRRSARPSLEGLAHAALIGTPRYVDPKTGKAISPEAALHVLNRPEAPRSKLARLQRFVRKLGL